MDALEVAGMWPCFSGIRQSGQFFDVDLVSSDGVSFPSHQVLLAAMSPHFKTVFTTDNEDSTEDGTRKTVHLEIDSKVLKVVLDYVYSLSPAINNDNAQSVSFASKQLQMWSLLADCVSLLKRSLLVDNCVRLHKFAVKKKIAELELASKHFILRHFSELVQKSEQFENLDQCTLLQLLARDTLGIKSEEELFLAVMKWIDHEPALRASSTPALLQHVRLGLMQADFFFQKVAPNKYVKKYSTECRTVLKQAYKCFCKLEQTGYHTLDLTNTLTRPRLPRAVILTIGGWSNGSPVSTVESYDACADRWLYQVKAEDVQQRAYHGLACHGGFVYIIGGFDGSQYYSSTRKFDPVLRRWSDAAPMYNQRCYVSAAVLGGKIYACGGYDGHMRLKAVERYHDVTNQWTIVASLLSRRSDAGAEAFNGKLYVAGGFNGDHCLRSAECYCPESDQWTALTSLTSFRSGMSLVAYRDCLYALGGFDGERRLRSVETYCPLSGCWEVGQQMHTTRSNFTAVVCHSRLYVIGGFNGSTTIGAVEYLDADEAWNSVCDINTTKSALKACVIQDIPNLGEYSFHHTWSHI